MVTPSTTNTTALGAQTRDGDLQFIFDKNGNRTEIGYPGGVSALYTLDFADREKTLDVELPGAGVEPWVTDSTYYASGPLQLLDFANGVQETRTHDQRYFPDQILAAGPSSTLLLWQYTTDDVGNITLIDDLQSSSDRVYGKYSPWPVLTDPPRRDVSVSLSVK